MTQTAGRAERQADYAAQVWVELRRRLVVRGATAYLTDPVNDYPARGGKSLRPGLCLATCEAFGGPAADALPSAVAIEILHNAFLVHDDIEDTSRLRRGQPTLHERFGLPMAINAGDALALAGASVLRDNIDLLGPRLAEQIMIEFDFMTRQTVDGQALELGWRQDNRLDLTPGDYLQLIMKKTCWYTTILPLRVGALIGSRGWADLRAMIEFGFYLGTAFQIRDDLLNLAPQRGEYGKERFGDLLEGKRTLSLIHLLAAADPGDRRWIESYLAKPFAERQLTDARELYRMMRRYGSIGFAYAYAAGIARTAGTAMDAAFAGLADTPAKRYVWETIWYMVDRTC